MGRPPEQRWLLRQSLARPVMDGLAAFLDASLTQISGRSELAKAIRYARSRWTALTRYLDDGTLEISNNAAERAIRPLALGRKNYLFAGSDAGGERAAAAYTLVETALCRPPNYAERLCNRCAVSANLRAIERASSCSIRHSLVAHSASRKASRRSFGRKRVRLPRSYGFSFARAASLSERWACR